MSLCRDCKLFSEDPTVNNGDGCCFASYGAKEGTYLVTNARGAYPKVCPFGSYKQKITTRFEVEKDKK